MMEVCSRESHSAQLARKSEAGRGDHWLPFSDLTSFSYGPLLEIPIAPSRPSLWGHTSDLSLTIFSGRLF